MAKDDPIPRWRTPASAGMVIKKPQVPQHNHPHQAAMRINSADDDYKLEVYDRDLIDDDAIYRAARITHAVRPIGAITGGAQSAALLVHEVVNMTSDIADSEATGLYGKLTTSGTGDLDYNATLPAFSGVVGALEWGSSGVAYRASALATNVVVTDGDGSVNAIGLHVREPTITAGKAALNAGIYIEDQASNASFDYAILSLGGDINIADGNVTFNSTGDANSDFTIESDTQNIFFVDAGSEYIRMGDGGGTDYVEVEADGTLEFNGTATAWEDLRVPVSAVRVPGAKAPTWTAYSASQLLGFSYQAVAGNEEEIYFVAQVPHSYKEGSNITPHVHWVPNEDTVDDPEVVRWGLEYEWINMDGTFAGTTTIYAEESMTDRADDHIRTDFSAITGTGKTMSSMIVCRLFRNSSHENDTYDNGTALALLLETDFHFEQDTVGSRAILTK